MSDNSWKVGDLAVCIDDRWGGSNAAISPRKEELLRVTGVSFLGARHFLGFKEKVDDHFWDGLAFRKVKPDTEPAADEEWVRQLQHLRRKELA